MSDYKIEETQLGTKTTHPSYGTLKFSRCSGGKTPLFGSSIEHRDIISVELHHADVTRGLNRDWIYGGDLIAKAEMSYAQFAEAITSMNMGTGVPVTICYTEKDGEMPKCDFVSKREQFVNEFKDTLNTAMKDSQDLIKELSELFGTKKSLTKSDKEKIISKLTQISYNVGSNAEFVAKQFNEQMDKTITEAKGEIEAFCQNKINTIANAALVEQKDDMLKLENPVELNIE